MSTIKCTVLKSLFTFVAFLGGASMSAESLGLKDKKANNEGMKNKNCTIMCEILNGYLPQKPFPIK